jgi:dienelactone hydrolase
MYAFIPFAWYNGLSATLPKVKKFMDDFRCSEGASLPVGAVGFCWGGYMVTHLAHGDLAKNGKPLVDAVFTAHPSALAIPADIEKVKQPYSVSIGDKDFALKVDGIKKMQEVLEGKKDVESEVVMWVSCPHRFLNSCSITELTSNSAKMVLYMDSLSVGILLMRSKRSWLTTLRTSV